jgi:hypothetical protein
LDKPDKALKALEKHPTFLPQSPMHALYTARALSATGILDSAISAYRHAILYAPDDLHLRYEIELFLKKHPNPELRQITQKLAKAPLSHP